MKKTAKAALAATGLAAIAFLTMACASGNASRVTILSGGGNEHEAISNGFSFRSGGMGKRAKDVADDLMPISPGGDFQIIIEGRRRFPPTYNVSRLTDGEWERVLVVQTRRGNFNDVIFLTRGSRDRDDWEQAQAESFLDLLNPGEYILEVSVSWGNRRSGFEGQHFFRLTK